jgi:hypothetical protein
LALTYQKIFSFLPLHLKESFGNNYLELFYNLDRMGYNKLDKCIQFLQTVPSQRDWRGVKILIFDAPQSMDKPYSGRLDILKQSTLLKVPGN